MWLVNSVRESLRLFLGLVGFGMIMLFIVSLLSLAIVLAYVIAKEVIRDGILDRGEWLKGDKHE